jgi:hypothetical protein
MSKFTDFLKNKKKFVVQEQGVIGGPFVDGALEGLGVNNKMRDAGKALGQGAKDTVVGVGSAIGKGIKDGQGVKGAAIGAMDAIGQGAKDTVTGLGRAIFGQNAGDDPKDIRRKYLELQTALINYSDAIKNSPSLKQTKQGQEISDSIQKALQEIENSISATHNMYQQSEKRIRPLNPNLPIPERGFIRPE